MQIIVNGVATDIESAELTHVLHSLGYVDVSVATALNGEFVPASIRSSIMLSEGDKLEVLAPMQGG